VTSPAPTLPAPQLPTRTIASQAASGTYTIETSSMGGFTGNVTFGISGLPAGSTASFSPAAPAVGVSSNLTVHRGTTTATGVFTLTITATSGAVSHTVDVRLILRDFGISASAAAPLVAGASGTATVTVSSPLGFVGGLPIALDATGLPAGVSVSFSPASIASSPLPAQSTLAFDVAPTVAPGTYPITVTGTSGVLVHAAVVQLTVDAIPNHAPACATAFPSVASLWAPDNRLVPVSVLGVSDPEGDAVTLAITSIMQDELTNNENNLATAIDAFIVGPGQMQLRAQRGTPRAAGNGRAYHVSFTAADASGASCTGEVIVGVPATQGGTAVDNGALYDSTVARRQ
jgi:hypothetical protein